MVDPRRVSGRRLPSSICIGFHKGPSPAVASSGLWGGEPSSAYCCFPAAGGGRLRYGCGVESIRPMIRKILKSTYICYIFTKQPLKNRLFELWCNILGEKKKCFSLFPDKLWLMTLLFSWNPIRASVNYFLYLHTDRTTAKKWIKSNQK